MKQIDPGSCPAQTLFLAPHSLTDRAHLGFEPRKPPSAAFHAVPGSWCLKLPERRAAQKCRPAVPCVLTWARTPNNAGPCGMAEGTHLKKTQHSPQAVQYGCSVSLEKGGGGGGVTVSGQNFPGAVPPGVGLPAPCPAPLHRGPLPDSRPLPTASQSLSPAFPAVDPSAAQPLTRFP